MKKKNAHKDRLNALRATAQAVVATGRCPDCGAPLRSNLAITGWWQCSQYGAVGFRAKAEIPACAFQCFV